MFAGDLTSWVGIIVRGIDDLLFEFLPYAFNHYVVEMPISAIIAVLVLLSGIVVYVTLLPTQRGDVANIGVIMVLNAAVKATKGLAILAFYGSLIGLFGFAIMRMLP